MSQVTTASVILLKLYQVCVLLNKIKYIFLSFGLWLEFESHFGSALLLLHTLIPEFPLQNPDFFSYFCDHFILNHHNV